MTDRDERIRVISGSSGSSDELRRMVRDAIEHVLARPDGRRGPYVIDEEQLRPNSSAKAS